jgi:hypothetical protein
MTAPRICCAGPSTSGGRRREPSAAGEVARSPSSDRAPPFRVLRAAFATGCRMSHWFDEFAKRAVRDRPRGAAPAPAGHSNARGEPRKLSPGNQDRGGLSRRHLLASAGAAGGIALASGPLRRALLGTASATCPSFHFACSTDPAEQACFDKVAKDHDNAISQCPARAKTKAPNTSSPFGYFACIAQVEWSRARAENNCPQNSPVICCPASGGMTCCDGQCLDTRSDPQNCGACKKVCPPGQRCEQGLCRGCQAGETTCNNVCVNLQTDNNNCGTCGHVCVAPSTCQSGKCQSCSGADLQSDPNNCGVCGNVCDSGACSNGECCTKTYPASSATCQDAGGSYTVWYCSGYGPPCSSQGYTTPGSFCCPPGSTYLSSESPSTCCKA